MIASRTKLLPPSFFQQQQQRRRRLVEQVSRDSGNHGPNADNDAVTDADSEEDIVMTDNNGLCDRHEDEEECLWVPLGFAEVDRELREKKKKNKQKEEEDDDEGVSQKRIRIPSALKKAFAVRRNVDDDDDDDDNDDPFDLAASSSSKISTQDEDLQFLPLLRNPFLTKYEETFVNRKSELAGNRKRCSPYPPLDISSEAETKSSKNGGGGEKLVRLMNTTATIAQKSAVTSTATEWPRGLYAPLPVNHDAENDDGSLEEARSEEEETYVVLGAAAITTTTFSGVSDDAADATAARSGDASTDAAAVVASAEDPAVRISKQLSWLLRHGANRVGLRLDDDGFLDVESILKLREFSDVSMSDIVSIVRENDKKRFTLKTDSDTGLLKVRANQGHSLAVGKLDIKRITALAASSRFYKNVIHGTFPDAWELIKKSGGLSRMTRNHIHFAMGEPGKTGATSGVRSHATIWIYVDVPRAIQDGFQFFISSNKVILTPGNGAGFLPTAYFVKAVQLAPFEILDFDRTTTITTAKTKAAAAATATAASTKAAAAATAEATARSEPVSTPGPNIPSMDKADDDESESGGDDDDDDDDQCESNLDDESDKRESNAANNAASPTDPPRVGVGFRRRGGRSTIAASPTLGHPFSSFSSSPSHFIPLLPPPPPLTSSSSSSSVNDEPVFVPLSHAFFASSRSSSSSSSSPSSSPPPTTSTFSSASAALPSTTTQNVAVRSPRTILRAAADDRATIVAPIIAKALLVRSSRPLSFQNGAPSSSSSSYSPHLSSSRPLSSFSSSRRVRYDDRGGRIRSSLDMETSPDRNRYPRSPCSPFRTPPPASELPAPLPDFLRKTRMSRQNGGGVAAPPMNGFVPLAPDAGENDAAIRSASSTLPTVPPVRPSLVSLAPSTAISDLPASSNDAEPRRSFSVVENVGCIDVAALEMDALEPITSEAETLITNALGVDTWRSNDRVGRQARRPCPSPPSEIPDLEPLSDRGSHYIPHCD